MTGGALTEYSDTLEVAVAENFDLGESPIWDARSDTLLFVDCSRGHIHRFIPDDGSIATLEIGQIKAGRCEKAQLSTAGIYGHVSCEQGHCDCGYYNGLRVEAFEGPFDLSKVGNRLPPGWLQWGFAEHHLREGEFHDM